MMIAGRDAPMRRAIRLPHATAMVVGTILGASIFVQPSEITGRIHSVGGVFTVWAFSGLLTLFGALICAELSSIHAGTGGVYVYLREALSPAIAFLWGWAMFWTMHSGIIAAIAVVFARYLAYFLPGFQGVPVLLLRVPWVPGASVSLGHQEVAAVGVILVLSAVNYAGVRQGSLLQSLFTLVKVMAVVLIIAAGFIFGRDLPGHFEVSGEFKRGVSLNDFGLAMVAGLFAFGGWHMVTYNAEETVDPKRTIPRSLIIGTLVVTLCYLALNAVYMYVLPLEEVAASPRIAADAADRLFGGGGGAIMAGLVAFSSFGALSGIILAGPRVYLAMARDRLLFGWVDAVHSRYRTPHRAILLQALWSSALVLTGTYRALFARVIYTEWIFFGLLAVCVFVLRRRPECRREYSVPGYPWVPALFALASFGIVANHVLSDIRDHGIWTDTGGLNQSLTGLAIVLAGLPVYYCWAGRKGR